MRNRRLAIIAALSIVELWIVGLMIRSVSCGTTHDSSFANAATQTGDSVERTIATGPSPRVTIDEDDAAVTVTVRAGSTVSVAELIRGRKWGIGSRERRSTVEQTADGVRITQPDDFSIVGGSSVTRQVAVTVPPGARLAVENAGRLTVAGLRGDATIHSDDGAISVSDQRGSLTVTADDGQIALADVVAPALHVSADDGHISFDRVQADDVSVTTDDGHIDIARSLLRGGTVKSGDGHIRIGLDPQSNVTVSAVSSSGHVVAESPLTVSRAGDDDDAPSLIRVGSGAGRLDVASDDGSITVLAGGV